MAVSEVVLLIPRLEGMTTKCLAGSGVIKHGPLISPGRLEFLSGVYDQTALFACREYAQLVDLTADYLLVAAARMADRV